VFGFACHIGTQLKLPSVGVAKTLYHVDGIENNEEHHQKVCNSTIICFRSPFTECLGCEVTDKIMFSVPFETSYLQISGCDDV